MSWDENKHPRDDDGKFTFKNGGDNTKKESPANILYGKSKAKKELEKTTQKEKSKLLDILGDKATPADILYADNDKLNEKIKENGLGKKLKDIQETPTGFAANTYISTKDDRLKELNQYKTPIEEQYKRNKGYSEIWEGDDNFKKAMVRMFNREKEYNNSKYDLGGETNLGITIGTLNDYKRKHPDFKDVDIKKITKDQDSRIYYDEYWKKSGADKIKDKDLAYIHFDATVNHGLGNSRRFLKESGENFDKYIEIRKKYYNDIVKNKPEQERHIKGWMNRLNEIKENRGNLF